MFPPPTLPPAVDYPNDLASRLLSLLTQTLEPIGFIPTSNYRRFYSWTRRTQTLEQRCRLEFFEASFYFGYDYRFLSPSNFESWGPFDAWPPAEAAAARRILERFEAARRDFVHRVGFAKRHKTFDGFCALDLQVCPYSVGNADVAERSFATFRKTLEEHIAPFFERRREALDLLRAYDDGSISAVGFNLRFDATAPPVDDAGRYFGDDPILNALNLIGLRFQNKQSGEALVLADALADFLLRFDANVVDFTNSGGFYANCYNAPFASPYCRAAFEVALLGVEIARRRIAVDGPGPQATRRPLEPFPPQALKHRQFKRPAFTSPGVDEAEVASLLWTARFSNNETKAARALQRLEELANQAAIVVYEGPNNRRLVANATFDAESPIPAAAPAPLQPKPTPVPKNADDATSTFKDDLRRRLEEVFAQRLEPLGFKGGRSQRWTQKTRSLSRYCRFAFLDSRNAVAVAFGYSVLPCYACWDDAPQDAESQELIARFRKEKPRFDLDCANFVFYFDSPSDFFGANIDLKYPDLSGDPEPLVVEADTFLRAEIIPFFERFPETDDLLREYDAGRLEQAFALGRSAGPDREFVAAQNYYRAGNYVEALARFEAVPERFRELAAAPRDARDELLLEVARLGALSVRKKLESIGDEVVSPVPRRPITPVPEPLATALPFADSRERRTIFGAREIANSAFAPEAEPALRRLEAGAETLRTFQEKTAQVLEPLGFTRESPISWLRETATLRQRFALAVFLGGGCHFGFGAQYYQKLDLSPWAAAPQDAETQTTLARMQAIVEQRFANAPFAEKTWSADYSRVFLLERRASSPSPLEKLLNEADKELTNVVLPFFDASRKSPDALLDSAPLDVLTRFALTSYSDSTIGKFGFALALFQSGRYTESSKKFDALAKRKKKPNDDPEYDDADWATLQEAARIAATSVRQLEKHRKTPQ